MDEWNPREELGLGLWPSPAEVEHAYCVLSWRFHPDRSAGASAERFRRLGYAYELLHPPRSFVRDSARETETARRFLSWEEYTDAEALKTFLRFMQSRSSGPQGGDLSVVLDVDLRDIVQGGYKVLEIIRDQVCPECSGSGGGSPDYCRGCEGRGLVRTDERLGVEIFPGTLSGNARWFAGQGQYDPRRGECGDLMVLFRESLPESVSRHGADAYVDTFVELTTLVLGGTASVQGLNGEQIYFKIPPATTPGRRITVPGKGFPRPRSRLSGNLICRVWPRLDIPDEEEKQLFTRLRELKIARGGLQYHSFGRFGVISLNPLQDSPALPEQMADLALILRSSGLEPAVDLSAFAQSLPESVSAALLSVYQKCFSSGCLSIIASPALSAQLNQLQIGSLFRVVMHQDQLHDTDSGASGLRPYRQGNWEIYPMGSTSLNSDFLLETPALVAFLEPQGHPFKAYDLRWVPQVDSFFIGKLVRCYKYVQTRSGMIALIGASEGVRRVLVETGVQSLFLLVQNAHDLPG